MLRTASIAAGAGLLLLAACQPSNKPQPLTGADSTAITKLAADYAAAWNKGNVDGVVSLYTSDAVLHLEDTVATERVQRDPHLLQQRAGHAHATDARHQGRVDGGTAGSRRWGGNVHPDAIRAARAGRAGQGCRPRRARARGGPVAQRVDEAGRRQLEDRLGGDHLRRAEGRAGPRQTRAGREVAEGQTSGSQSSCQTPSTEVVTSLKAARGQTGCQYRQLVWPLDSGGWSTTADLAPGNCLTRIQGFYGRRLASAEPAHAARGDREPAPR